MVGTPKIGLTAAIIAMMLITTAHAAGGYGTSTILLNSSSVTVALGGAATVGYTVNLSSGKTWGTNLVIDNQSALQQLGIDLSPSVNTGEPPFSGVLSIQLTQFAKPGTYKAMLSATGDDPSTNNAVLTIIVSQSAPTNSSGASGQAPGQTQSSTSGSPVELYALIAAIIIIVILAVVFLGRRSRNKPV